MGGFADHTRDTSGDAGREKEEEEEEGGAFLKQSRYSSLSGTEPSLSERSAEDKKN